MTLLNSATYICAQDGPFGVDVCLTCFNGGCTGNEDREHAALHFQKTGHALVVNVKRREKPKSKNVRGLYRVARNNTVLTPYPVLLVVIVSADEAGDSSGNRSRQVRLYHDTEMSGVYRRTDRRPGAAHDRQA